MVDHERVIFINDSGSALHAIIAIHSTILGPALGGLRVRVYDGGISEALQDVLGLARTMTLKAAAAGLDLGGGKAVVLDDGQPELRERRLQVLAGVMNELRGRYITAEDIGTSVTDMDFLAGHTQYVVGLSEDRDGGGDPSVATAETVTRAINEAIRIRCGSSGPAGLRIGVAGVGKVGSLVARNLARAGAELVVFDPSRERASDAASETGARLAASEDDLLSMELDVLAPCATGGLVNEPWAERLGCAVVAGAANNPLTSRSVEEILARRGILYVPDFLANCGGLINVFSEWHGHDPVAVQDALDEAMSRLRAVLEEAMRAGRTPNSIAMQLAEERIKAAQPSHDPL